MDLIQYCCLMGLSCLFFTDLNLKTNSKLKNKIFGVYLYSLYLMGFIGLLLNLTSYNESLIKFSEQLKLYYLIGAGIPIMYILLSRLANKSYDLMFYSFKKPINSNKKNKK